MSDALIPMDETGFDLSEITRQFIYFDESLG